MSREHPRPGAAHARALQAAQEQRQPAISLAPKSPPPRRSRCHPLPDGATFTLSHDSRRVCFHGSLALPAGEVFRARGGGVRSTMEQLYIQYDKFVEASHAETPPPPR